MSPQPETQIDARFGTPAATPTPWSEARDRAEGAELWWITTVRADRRPHITPLLAVWLDDALHFCTGPTEQKAKNLARNPQCALTTGVNTQDDGLDLVVEGRAVRVTDEARLQRLADAWEAKYGADWRFRVRDHAFVPAEESPDSDDPGPAHVFEVAPTTAFGFGKGEVFSQTRWRFSPPIQDDGPLAGSEVATRLPAQDLDRARVFYAEKLGLHPVDEREGGLLYRCGSSSFALFASSGRPTGEHTQMGWDVGDIDATVAELRRRGVTFEEVEVPGLRTVDGIADIEGNYPSKGVGERAAWFRDSEGNLIGMGQAVR